METKDTKTPLKTSICTLDAPDQTHRAIFSDMQHLRVNGNIAIPFHAIKCMFTIVDNSWYPMTTGRA